MKRNKLKLRKKYLKNSLTMNIIKKLKTYRQQQWKKPSCQVKYENPATKRKTENNPGYDDIRREQLKYSPEVIENSMCETKRSSRNNSAPPPKKKPTHYGIVTLLQKEQHKEYKDHVLTSNKKTKTNYRNMSSRTLHWQNYLKSTQQSSNLSTGQNNDTTHLHRNVLIENSLTSLPFVDLTHGYE